MTSPKIDSVAPADRRESRSPEARPRYSLDELLAQCDPAEGPAAEDRDWMDAKPVGKELL